MTVGTTPSSTKVAASETIHTWFGTDDSPLFGVIHQPADRRVSGAVVLCPAVGHEQTMTDHGQRLLATELATRGFLVLRFDYRGTGHSSGRGEDVTIEKWIEDITIAVTYVRSSGVKRVSVVGLRLGALLAVQAVPNIAPIDLVLWDPVVSGRRFIREEQSRLKMTVDSDFKHPTLLALTGWSLPRDVADTVKKLNIDSLVGHDAVDGLLAAIRPGAGEELAEQIASIGGQVVEAPENADFVTPSEFVQVFPRRTVAHIVFWCVQRANSQRVEFAQLPIRTTAVVERTSDGTDIIERIRWIGRRSMFCIETASPDFSGKHARAEVVFHSTANDRCVGQGRMWPELAREFASRGIRSLRFDRRAVGESPGAIPGKLSALYTPEDREDVHEISNDLVLEPQRQMQVGLCSGAWMATQVSLSRPGTVLCALGPLMWKMNPPYVDEEYLLAHGWDLEKGRAPDHQVAPDPWKVTLKTMFRMKVPYRGWYLLSKTGKVGCPEDMLRALVDNKVRTTIVFPAGDRRAFELQRGSDALRAIGKSSDLLDIRDLDGDWDDHVLLGLEYRLQTMDVVLEVATEMLSR